MTTINPFHNPQSAYSPKAFNYSGKCLFSHRGVSVYQNNAGSWDYVFEGMTITQRAGFKRDAAVLVINGILDGVDTGHFHWVCDKVAAHLRSFGHSPIGYSQAA